MSTPCHNDSLIHSTSLRTKKKKEKEEEGVEKQTKRNLSPQCQRIRECIHDGSTRQKLANFMWNCSGKDRISERLKFIGLSRVTNQIRCLHRSTLAIINHADDEQTHRSTTCLPGPVRLLNYWLSWTGSPVSRIESKSASISRTHSTASFWEQTSMN